MQIIWKKLVDGTAQFFKKAGFKKAVVGLSGGIDSSVTAVIAAKALGHENVLGALMPGEFSSRGSVDDSLELAKNLKINTRIIPINPIVQTFKDIFEKAVGEKTDDGTMQNLQARIRAVILMAISNNGGFLLLNTCNKSEDYVGYCTLYGDCCGAVAPIGDLYKTRVYELAGWINNNKLLPNIPGAIINKAPSAELKPNQKDIDDLLEYDILDPMLRMIVDEKMKTKSIAEKGYDIDIIKSIKNMYLASEFKRQQSPPCISIK